MSKKKYVCWLLERTVPIVAAFVFCSCNCKPGSVLEVEFRCPSGQVSYLTSALLGADFPGKALTVYRQRHPMSELTDGEFCSTIDCRRICQQSYKDSMWNGRILFSVHAKTQELACEVSEACLQTVREFVFAHNKKFEERSLAYQRGRILKLERRIKQFPSDSSLREALSNELCQVEISKRIVEKNFVEMIVHRISAGTVPASGL